jgi:hypothetical protein
MAAALMVGSASAYNNDAGFSMPLPWDEEGTINQATTGLTTGYLGAPLGPAQRVARYTSGELITNGNFEQDVSSLTTNMTIPGSMTASQDQTTAAPGFGTASARIDVTAITPSPAVNDARVLLALSAPLAIDKEYTIDFWAKGVNNGQGPPVLDLGVSLNAVLGAPQIVAIGAQWTHYTVAMLTTMLPPNPKLSAVKFFMGRSTGSYWLDGISIHQGTDGIITRQFANGIAVLNDSFSPQTLVDLPGGPYHHINGVQDRLVNDGTSVGTILPIIAQKDGQILLRG